MKKLFIMTLMAAFTMSANAAEKENNYDTIVVTPTPMMHCQNCENKIKSNIRFVKGTKKIETSVEKQTVTIIYDKRKATPADYEKAFKKIGYEVKKASPQA